MTTPSNASIRQTVLAHLVAGTDRKAIAAALAYHFPASQAAKKSTAHIAWYAGWLKKNPAERAKFEGQALRFAPTPTEVPAEAPMTPKDVTALVAEADGTVTEPGSDAPTIFAETPAADAVPA